MMVNNEVIRFRCSIDFKAMAGKAAAMEGKDLSKYIVALIEADCQKKGLMPVHSGYYVNFNTGAGNKEAESLEEAMDLAVKGAAYTQQPISILYYGQEVACLPWYGIAPDDDEVVTIQFGSFGYYGAWEIS